ncbi:hypothetical protein Dimus_033746 [Dionaea muscipula]
MEQWYWMGINDDPKQGFNYITHENFHLDPSNPNRNKKSTWGPKSKRDELSPPLRESKKLKKVIPSHISAKKQSTGKSKQTEKQSEAIHTHMPAVKDFTDKSKLPEKQSKQPQELHKDINAIVRREINVTIKREMKSLRDEIPLLIKRAVEQAVERQYDTLLHNLSKFVNDGVIPHKEGHHEHMEDHHM